MKAKHSFSDLVSLLVPDVLEKAYADVEGFIAARTDRSAQHVTAELVANSRSLVEQFGQPVELALFALLCQDSDLRPALDEAVGGGVKAGVALVVPILVGQFALAPAVALVVATLVIKTFAMRGQPSQEEKTQVASPSQVIGQSQNSPIKIQRTSSSQDACQKTCASKQARAHGLFEMTVCAPATVTGDQ